MTLENVAKDYSKYCDVDINLKLKPINQSVDDMLTRLEEFQTMVSFVKQDGIDSNDILTSFLNFKSDMDEMCIKINTIENLITHIKSNLDKLEDDMDKAETEMGCNEHKNKVTNIFTPLFKKNTDKKQIIPNMELFKTDDYFN
ncbi:hypothetical protein NQ314_001898 [Rhamnusium bicolor]|uniref:Uncharacterized protein n=1 Tax=Rhamnusium bicolor TaxID=1586634 RepID=A0AAV8ZUB5_9CUCU|nr:hypothetical protein NQ314_001898 [Rhamnusium bicolor]